jgi:hypothetical protein
LKHLFIEKRKREKWSGCKRLKGRWEEVEVCRVEKIRYLLWNMLS